MISNYLLLAASACVYVLSFLLPTYCWWMIFFFIPFILFRITRGAMEYPFLEGYFWGLCAFGLHMFWIFVLMTRKAFAWQLGLLGATVLICFFALSSAFWFWGAECFAKSDRLFMRLIMWTCSAFSFFIFVDRYIFFLSGQCDGYPLMFPLLPLAVQPKLLLLLPYVGSYFLLACLLFAGMFFVLFFFSYRISAGVGFCICLLPFAFGCFFNTSQSVPEYTKKIAYLTPPARDISCYEQFADVMHKLAARKNSDAEISMICMPETTISAAFNMYSEWVDALDMVLSPDVALCFGSHAFEDNEWHNRLYFIKNGKISAFYDKQHCMPFAEHLLFPWSHIPCVQEIMLHQCQQFCAGGKKRAVIVHNDFQFLPYMCSELFCMHDAPKEDNSIPIICIINDSWFAGYVRRLLHLLARYKAILWQRVIIYVGHYETVIYAPDGSKYYVYQID